MSAREIQARARVRAWKAAQRLLLGPVAGTLPGNAIRSIDEHSDLSAVRDHVIDRRPWRDETTANYPFPPDYPPEFRRSKVFDARPLFRLRDVCVSPQSGLTWLPGGPVLEESIGSLRRLLGWGGVLHEPLLSCRPLDVDRPLVTCPPTGYFHWLMEVLPAVVDARHLDPVPRVLIPSGAPRYLTDALALLVGNGRTGDEVVEADDVVRVPELVLPVQEPYSGFVHPAALDTLRTTFGARRADAGGRSALYVSRRHSPKRRVEGERELEHRLAERGFEILFCEQLPFAQQVEAFSRAEVVVGPHGAGLANLVWAGHPCRVVEIFPAGKFNDCYARLSTILGHEYAHTTCAPEPGTNGRIVVEDVLRAIDG